METLFFVAMVGLLAYVIYRNVRLLGRYRHNKEYIETYNAMFNKDEGAYEKLCTYISNETSEEFKNKARILKIFADLDRSDENVSLSDLDLRQLFYKKDKFSKSMLALNCDSFIWLYLDLAKARRLSRFDVIDALSEKMKEMSELNNRVEYQLFFAIVNALCEKEDAGVAFLSALLEGGYAGLEYEKNLIGLYKRFAAATLAYSGEPMEDYYKLDLHSFAATRIGKNYMEELEIYDKYPPLADPEDKTGDSVDNLS